MSSEEDRLRRKKRSLEELQSLLAELKSDADNTQRTPQGQSWSDRIYRIQKQLEEYQNACDDYAAHLLDKKGN